MQGMSPRQQDLHDLMRGGLRFNPRVLQEADDEALAAGIAASLASAPASDAHSELQAKIESARGAGVPISARAVQRANDAALAAAIQASLDEAAPPAGPRPGVGPSSRPALVAPANGGVPSSEPAGEVNATPRATPSAAKDPYETLGVPRNARWRAIFHMEERLEPTAVERRAATAAGATEAMAEIAQARKDLARAYKRRMIVIHPDRNFGKDMRPVLDVVNAALDAGEKELAKLEHLLAERLDRPAPSA